MANSLGIDVTGKVVILSAEYYKGTESERRFLCRGGFGCLPRTIGSAVTGVFLTDGEEARVRGDEIEKLADDQTVTDLHGKGAADG